MEINCELAKSFRRVIRWSCKKYVIGYWRRDIRTYLYIYCSTLYVFNRSYVFSFNKFKSQFKSCLLEFKWFYCYITYIFYHNIAYVCTYAWILPSYHTVFNLFVQNMALYTKWGLDSFMLMWFRIQSANLKEHETKQNFEIEEIEWMTMTCTNG